MSLRDLFRREQRDAAPSSPPRLGRWGLPWMQETSGYGYAQAAPPEVVMSASAVVTRCVDLRASMLASVGLFLYRRTPDGGRERADDHPLYGVLHSIANDQMTAYEMREFLVRSLDMRGNAYARIGFDWAGRVNALYPLSPITTQVERLASGRLRYRTYDALGRVEVYTQDEVLHIRGPSPDGVVGQSPLTIARGAMGLRVSQAETSAALYANGLRPSGLVSFDERLNADAKAAARQGLTDTLAGSANAGKVLLMDGGAKWTSLSWSAEDAQFLDTTKLSNEDAARLYGCPPTSVGIADKATYSNTEQEARALVANCLAPLARRVETAMMRCLLTPQAQRCIYVEHDLDAMLRGDTTARFAAYRVAREIGVFSPNDIRRLENEPPIAQGDTYNQPANWVPLGAPPPVVQPPAGPGAQP
jgi:HK97 family phage portal protein